MQILRQAEQWPDRCAAMQPDLHLPTHLVRSQYTIGPIRHRTEQEYRDALLEDIKAKGITKPLLIYTDGERGYLGDGHHRLEAAERLGLPTVPAVVIPGMSHAMDQAKSLDPLVRKWLEEH